MMIIKRSLFLLVLSTSFSVAVVTSSGVSYRFNADELNAVYYDISLLATPAASGNIVDEGGNTFIEISNKNGQPFLCSVPPLGDSLLEADKDLEQRIEFVKNLSLDHITNALRTLENRKCLTKTVGWWTYEFCYNQAVYQYHVEGNVIDGEKIVLGRFEWDQTFNESYVIEEFVKRKHDLFHSQFYTNGSLCDLSSRLRKTEVKFFCDEEVFGAELLRVDEPETCSYILYVHSSGLCKLPAFLPANKKRDPFNISCRPALSSVDFELYKQKEEEKLKKENEKLLQLHSNEQLRRSKDIKEEDKEVVKTADSEDGDVVDSINTLKKNKLLDNFWQKMETVLEEAVKEQYEKLDKNGQGVENNLHIVDMNVDLGGDTDKTLESKKVPIDKVNNEEQSHLNEAKDSKDATADDEEAQLAEFEKELRKLTGSFYSGLDKNQLRGEVEEQYDELIADARDELLDEYDFPYSATTNDEAIRTLSQTLNKLIDRLDRAEREIEIANEQLEEAEHKLDAASKSLAKMLQDGSGVPEEKLSSSSSSSSSAAVDDDDDNTATNGARQKLHLSSNKKESLYKSAKLDDQAVDYKPEPDDNEDDDSSMSHQLPLGRIQIKRKPLEGGDAQDEALTEKENAKAAADYSKNDRVKVRVSRIKSHGLPEKARGKVAEETQKLEAQLAAKLKNAGLDSKGGRIQVKIITSGYYDEETNKFHMLTDEESQQFSNIVLSLLDGNEQEKEEKRQKALEDSYNFNLNKN